MRDESSEPEEAVAIIGWAARVPGARDVEEIWTNLRGGVESLSRFGAEELAAAGVDPAVYERPEYVPVAGVLAHADRFDAPFFGYSPREARVMDPQHRVFLEASWNALEDAGYAGEGKDGLVGVFAGTSISTYLISNVLPSLQLGDASLADALLVRVGSDKDFLPSRVSYNLGLHGPSVNVQTACSTSLVAVHMAAESLLSYQSDLALAGGVSVNCPQTVGYLYQEGHTLSPDGRCRAFDAAAAGTVMGSGVAVVVLKRLSEAIADRDTLHAVILGSAINNDGHRKVGYAAPSVEGQAEVIAMAQASAGAGAETVGYVECHGTGTVLGDPIEVAALTRAFRGATDRRGFCALGSIKSNVGHLDAAAGVAGLIKAALAVERGEIPPSLHFERPNPEIDFASSPFYVNAELRRWPAGTGPRRAGVSSFGIGGTNAHAVVEEPPAPAPPGPARPWQLLVLSARTTAALDTLAERLARFLEEDRGLELADVAFTLAVGRREFEHRRAVVCKDRSEGAALLGAPAPRPSGPGVEAGAAGLIAGLEEAGDELPERLQALGALWEAGGDVDWRAFYAGQKRRRVPLPTYPFAGERHWLDPPRTGPPAVSRERLEACERAVTAAEAQLAAARRLLGSLGTEAVPAGDGGGEARGDGTGVEGRLGQILKELLEVEEVDSGDDFFDLGGDSMIAVQLLSRLKSAFGVEIAHRDLLQAPKVRQIAELVRRRTPGARTATPADGSVAAGELPSELVALRSGANGAAPFFLVHPVGGTVYFYRDLVAALELSRTVYGIEARGIDGREEPRSEIGDMARSYLESVRRAQPAGPYRLGGASFGGLVAYEMARQLRAGGEEVALLTMIDTPAPETVPEDFKSEEGILLFLARTSAESSSELSVERFESLDLESKRRDLLEHLREHDPSFSGGMEELRAFLHLYLTHMRAMAEYRPADYPGRIVFFRARERRPVYDPSHPELPWLDRASEGVEVHVVPGDHVSVNFKPHVEALARRLRRHLG